MRPPPGRRFRDTWREDLAWMFVCPWRGHDWRRKMYGVLCARCLRFYPHQRIPS
jgi:hypothetical protein